MLKLPESLFPRNLIADELWELFSRVGNTKKVTTYDRNILQTVLFSPGTTREEFELINRLYWLLRQGKLRLVD